MCHLPELQTFRNLSGSPQGLGQIKAVISGEEYLSFSTAELKPDWHLNCVWNIYPPTHILPQHPHQTESLLVF